MIATICPINPPGHDWQNGLSCRWCTETRTPEDAILSGLASRRGGTREAARVLLDAYTAQVRAELAGAEQQPDAPNDRRRGIYVDGKGDGWIDLTVDPETGERELAGITNPWKIASADEVRNDTGDLREIGRCW